MDFNFIWSLVVLMCIYHVFTMSSRHLGSCRAETTNFYFPVPHYSAWHSTRSMDLNRYSLNKLEQRICKETRKVTSSRRGSFISVYRRNELAVYQAPLRQAFLQTKAAFESYTSGRAFSRDPGLAFPRESSGSIVKSTGTGTFQGGWHSTCPRAGTDSRHPDQSQESS